MFRAKTRWLVLAASLIAVSSLALISPAQAAFKTALLIAELYPLSPFHPFTAFAPDPQVSEVTYSGTPDSLGGTQGPLSADIYRPRDEARHAALILVHGVAKTGKGDFRLVLLGNSLARAGMVVMVPQFDDLANNIVRPSTVEAIVDSFQFLVTQPYVKPDRVGIAGFSVSASLGIVAAADPRIADKVFLVNSFGAYYDMADVVQAATTLTWEYQGQKIDWEPDEFLREVLINNLVSFVEDPKEREALQTLIKANSPSVGRASALDQLSPGARATYELLTNRSPDRVLELMRRLDPATQEILAKLSPKEAVSGLKASIFIMHGRTDPTFSYLQSLKLYDSLSDKSKAYISIFDIFHHVNPVLPEPTLQNILRLYAPEIVKFYLYIYRSFYDLW